jgi:hypothetical protein
MSDMKAISLTDGSHVHLLGHALVFQDANAPGNIAGLEYFLVQSLQN